MKSTRIKISVSQDGLLPQETAEIATLPFPVLPKKLLRALGFERVDSSTFVGVLPIFVSLGEKEQEIEIELGVTLPEMRKKVLEIVKIPARQAPLAKVLPLPEKSSGRRKKSHTRSVKTTVRKTKRR